jgi:hypothetical protein
MAANSAAAWTQQNLGFKKAGTVSGIKIYKVSKMR